MLNLSVTLFGRQNSKKRCQGWWGGAVFRVTSAVSNELGMSFTEETANWVQGLEWGVCVSD